MKVIHKYVLDQDIIQLPAGAEFLSLGVQQNTLCLYAIVDPDRTLVDTLRVVRTSEQIIDYHRLGDFRGTYQINKLLGGPLILHVFDIK